MKKFKTDLLGFTFAKKAYGNYIFNRKDKNGYFLKLDKRQLQYLTGKIKLTAQN